MYLWEYQVPFDSGSNVQVFPKVRVLEIPRELANVSVPFVLQKLASNQDFELFLVWLQTLCLLMVGQVGPNIRSNCNEILFATLCSAYFYWVYAKLRYTLVDWLPVQYCFDPLHKVDICRVNKSQVGPYPDFRVQGSVGKCPRKSRPELLQVHRLDRIQGSQSRIFKRSS